MKKTIKIVGIVVAVVTGLLVAAAITLSLVFDPNQYKGEIIRLVKDQTGRDLKIDKKIGWAFFPRLGVEAGGLELGNAAGFGKEPFAKIDAAGVHVALLPLLRGQLNVDRVYLHGLTLNLARNAAGRSNWQDMTERAPQPAKKEKTPQKKTDDKLPIAGLAVGRLELKRANLVWRDLQAGSTLAVKNLELGTSRFVANEPMDVQFGFELARDKAAPVKVALKSRLTASANALKLANVDLKLDDSRMTGSIDISNFASPALRFNLALDRIDLDRYTAAGSAPASSAPASGAQPAAGTAPVALPLSTLRGLDVNGKFQIGDLKAIGLRSTDVQIKLAARGGLITLGPNSAKLYGGRYRGETALDVRGKTPVIRLDEKLEQVQVGPLLKDMQLFDNYTGTGNITVKLTGQGFDANQIRQSLNGNAAIAFRDGKIEGMDLLKIIEQARALSDAAKGKPVSIKAQQSDATVFKSLTASAVITNGIARNDDLVLDGANLRASGRGAADLVRETLDYKLKATVAESAERRGTTVPVLIGGTFSKPTYGVDFGEVLKQQAEKKLEKELKKGLENLLQPKKRK